MCGVDKMTFDLINATNMSIQGAFTLVTSTLGISPDLLYIAPAVILVFFWCLFLYMAETRRDVGYAMFMMAISGMAFNDVLLSSVKYSITLGQSANLPLLMVFVSCYEVIMVLLLMNEAKNAKKEPRE